MSGTIKDPSGAVVPGATVSIIDDQTGTTRTTVTSEVGLYTLPNLLVGTYTAKIEAAGFATYSLTNVQVQAAQVVEVSAELAMANTAQTIQVQTWCRRRVRS